MVSIRLLIGLLAAIVVVTFGVKNMVPITVTGFRGESYPIPLFYLLLAFFAAGFLFAWLFGLLDKLRFHREIRVYRRRVRSMEGELEREREQGGKLLMSGNAGEGEGRSAPPPAGGRPAAPAAPAQGESDDPSG
ncbi:MAG: lipopolysaccharide assembly protein LapA domain-containing protein [bacterium]